MGKGIKPVTPVTGGYFCRVRGGESVPGEDGLAMPSRVPGRGPLVLALRALMQQAERYYQHRAATGEQQRWAAQVLDRLQPVLEEAIRNPQVQQDVQRTEQRRAVSRKTRT